MQPSFSSKQKSHKFHIVLGMITAFITDFIFVILQIDNKIHYLLSERYAWLQYSNLALHGAIPELLIIGLLVYLITKKQAPTFAKIYLIALPLLYILFEILGGIWWVTHGT